MTSTAHPHIQEALRFILDQKRQCWPTMPVIMVVDDHIGGMNNRGWYEARYHVENCHDYPEYISDLHDRLREVYGSTITIYRVERAEVWREIQHDANPYPEDEYIATSTCMNAIISFADLPMNQVDGGLVILQMQVDVSDVIFEGHEGESELVIKNPSEIKALRYIGGEQK